MNIGIDNEKPEITESEKQDYSLISLVGLVIALLCSIYLFLIFNFASEGQNLLFNNTTPTGGDMGAHILGPAFMRDELLPQFRLSGWSPYWYAGFPAYTFYMVIPPLMIIIVNAGFNWYISLPLIALLTAFCVSLRGSAKVDAVLRKEGSLSGDSLIDRWRNKKAVQLLGHYQKVFFWLLPAVAVLLTHVPYGIAFKLVSVSGAVLFPVSAWAMGRLARTPEPIPGLLAIAGLIFQLDTNFEITGGNVLSTLAGEFSASISLNLTLLALGVCIRGINDNKWHIRSAVLLALVALTHILPLFFLVPALLLVLLLRKGTQPMHLLFLGAVSLWLVAISLNEGKPSKIFLPLACLAVLAVIMFALIYFIDIRSNARWFAIVGSISFALAAFWLIPFLWAGKFDGLFIDMGFERLEAVGSKMMTDSMEIAIPIAIFGALASYVMKIKIGFLFSCQAILMGLLTANIGQGALWNERLLPFFYLSVYIACAVGVGAILRFLAAATSENWQKPAQFVFLMGLVAAAFAGFVATAMPLRIEVPGSSEVTDADGDTTFKWLAFENKGASNVQGWAKWNYSGYETKSRYLEYRNVMDTMATVGEEQGCGRALWEIDKELEYGTPMAMMLLPHWTDGCIASMEGLYFESSATTPFHFLNQSRLSQEPSRAQRGLPYQGFDIAKGVSQLQAVGVKYYMASRNDSIEAACALAERAKGSVCDIVDPLEDDREEEVFPLREIKLKSPESQPFAVFEVLKTQDIEARKKILNQTISSSFPIGVLQGSDAVEGLATYPVVVSGLANEDFLEEDIENKATVSMGVLAAASDSIDEQVALIEADDKNGQTAEEAREELEESWLEDTEHDRRFENGWIGQAVDFHNDPSLYASIPAASGPDNWPKQTGGSIEERVLPTKKFELTEDEKETLAKAQKREPSDWTDIEKQLVQQEKEKKIFDAATKEVQGGPAIVSDIKTTTNEISFSVDEIGKPVLVKTSYFPNWNVSGGKGPWRAGPNMMVVVPTKKNVSLTYGRTVPEIASTALSLVVMLGICLFLVKKRYKSFDSSTSDLTENELVPALVYGPNLPEEFSDVEPENVVGETEDLEEEIEVGVGPVASQVMVSQSDNGQTNVQVEDDDRTTENKNRDETAGE